MAWLCSAQFRKGFISRTCSSTWLQAHPEVSQVLQCTVASPSLYPQSQLESGIQQNHRLSQVRKDPDGSFLAVEGFFFFCLENLMHPQEVLKVCWVVKGISADTAVHERRHILGVDDGFGFPWKDTLRWHLVLLCWAALCHVPSLSWWKSAGEEIQVLPSNQYHFLL